MRNLLSITLILILVSATGSLLVGCGPASGPQVNVYLGYRDLKTKKVINTGAKTVDGLPPTSGFPLSFAGYLSDFAWPVLDLVNLKEDAMETGPHFKPELYQESLEGKRGALESLKSPRYQLWRKFYSLWWSAKDSCFNQILIEKTGKKIGDMKSTNLADIANLRLIPDLHQMPKKAYWTDHTPGISLVALEPVWVLLNDLNDTDQVAEHYFRDFKKEHKYYALLVLGDITYQLTLSYKNEHYSFETTVYNLVVRLAYIPIHIGNSKKKATWYWCLTGYDYYNLTSLNNKLAPAQSQPISHALLYGSSTSPPYQGARKKGISFPEIDFKINPLSIQS